MAHSSFKPDLSTLQQWVASANTVKDDAKNRWSHSETYKSALMSLVADILSKHKKAECYGKEFESLQHEASTFESQYNRKNPSQSILTVDAMNFFEKFAKRFGADPLPRSSKFFSVDGDYETYTEIYYDYIFQARPRFVDQRKIQKDLQSTSGKLNDGAARTEENQLTIRFEYLMAREAYYLMLLRNNNSLIDCLNYHCDYLKAKAVNAAVSDSKSVAVAPDAKNQLATQKIELENEIKKLREKLASLPIPAIKFLANDPSCRTLKAFSIMDESRFLLEFERQFGMYFLDRSAVDIETGKKFFSDVDHYIDYLECYVIYDSLVFKKIIAKAEAAQDNTKLYEIYIGQYKRQINYLTRRIAFELNQQQDPQKPFRLSEEQYRAGLAALLKKEQANSLPSTTTAAAIPFVMTGDFKMFGNPPSTSAPAPSQSAPAAQNVTQTPLKLLKPSAKHLILSTQHRAAAVQPTVPKAEEVVSHQTPILSLRIDEEPAPPGGMPLAHAGAIQSPQPACPAAPRLKSRLLDPRSK